MHDPDVTCAATDRPPLASHVRRLSPRGPLVGCDSSTVAFVCLTSFNSSFPLGPVCPQRWRMRRPLPRNPRVQTPRTSSRRKNLLPQLPQVCLRHIVMRGMWFRNECAHSLAAQFKRLLHFLSLCFPYHVSSNRSLWCALTRSCQSLHIENAVANTVERKISKAKIEELATPKRRSTQVRNGN